jgi:predicted amidophosphoribosyltransferase
MGELAVSVGVLVSSLIAIGLMAYFALRPERPGPRCPRCDNRVRNDDRVCRSCREPLKRADEDLLAAEDRP